MDLSKFRVDAEPTEEVVFEEPERYRFQGTVVAFDQSLSSTGWAKVKIIGGQAVVREVGNIKTSAVAKGHEDNLQRAMLVHRQVLQVMAMAKEGDTLVVHETPPVGGRMSRPESSLLAALGIRLAAQSLGMPLHMVGAQRAKKLLTGNSNADKKEVRATIDRVFPIVATLKPRNDDTYDAIALALAGAKEGPQ